MDKRSKSARRLSRVVVGSVVALVSSLAASAAYAAIAVSMSIAPGYANPIFPGDVTAFRITLTNSNTGAPITGVAFTNNLPSGLKVAGVGVKAYSCTDGDGAVTAGAGSLSASAGSGSITLSGGVVPVAKPSGASGRCDIDVEVTSTVPNSSQLNQIAAGAVTGDDGAPQSNGTPAQQTVTVNNLNLPVISKSFSSSNIVKSDETVTLTIVINNANNAAQDLPLNGLGDSPAYGLEDNLPAGLEVAAAPGATVSCPGGTPPSFSPAAGDTTLRAVGGVVAGGGRCTLTVKLVGTTTSGGFENNVTNVINRSTQFFNRRGLVPAQNASASLAIRSSLRVSKVFNPGVISAGQEANLTITLTNASPTSTITLDSGNPFVDSPIDGIGDAAYGLKVSSTPTTTCGGVLTTTSGNLGIQLAGGSIAPGASCTITVPFRGTPQTAGAPQSFTNVIPAGAVKTTDPSIVSEPDSASVNVVDQLLVTKNSSPAGAIAPGAPVRYTVTVSNYAASPLTNLVISDPLPGGMTALATSPAAPALSGSCSGLTHDIGSSPANPHFTVATVSAGSGPSPANCTVVFWAMTPKGGALTTDLINRIPAGGVTAGNVGGTVTNYSISTGTTLVTLANAITTNKSFSPASAFEGTASQLTVLFTNISAQPVTGASFTDPLPVGTTGQQLIVASPASASTTCPGGLVTATPGGSSVSMSGATIPARAANGSGANGTCTLTVSVVGAAGSYQNVLPAGSLTGTETYADGTTHIASSPGPVSATLTYNSALNAAKSFSPSTVTSGGMSTVTVQLGNIGAGALNNVAVTDPLPAGMIIAPTPNAYTTCGGAPVVTATPGASAASLSGAVIPAGGRCNFLFNVVATGASDWNNSIPAGNISAEGGVRNVAPVAAILANSSAGGVTVTNNTSPNSLTSPGQTAVLTLTLNNGGSIGLTGLSLTDYFTADGTPGGAQTGMVVAASPAAATTCQGGIVNATPDGTSVRLTGASLAAGASCTVSVNITLRTTGTVQNVIPIGAISNAQGVTNTLATTTSLSAGSNIGVTKRFSPPVVKPGERSRLQITFINPISLALTNLTAIDNLPAGLEIPTGANPTTTCTGATVSAASATQVSVTGGSLPAASAGASSICLAEIDVVAAAAGTYNNVIGVGEVSGVIGGAPANNPVAAPATLEVRTPATIGKVFAPDSVALGAPTTVTLTLSNPNTVPLTAAALADNLPDGLTVALTPNASTTCASGVVTAPASATSVLLTGGTIPAGGSCVVTFNAVSNLAGVFENTIPAGALATAQGVTNENPATDEVRIINPPTISKQFSPASIQSGGVSTLTLVLGNSNASPATLTSVLTDVLPTSPAPIRVASPNGVGGTCTLASVTAAPGGGSVSYASGAVIPAGGCTITVDVTGTTDGTYANVIGAGALKTNLGDNIQPANADLVISPLGFVSGRVFKDNNVVPNGTFEIAVDTPIAAAAITLTGTDYGPDGVSGGGDDAAVSRGTTTDTLGNYSFTGLNPGVYTVTEPTQPVGTQNGATTAGAVSGTGSPGTATGQATTPSAIGNIILLKNGGGLVGSSPGNNFAEVPTSSIAGSIFLDQDDNGVRNAADTALVGVTVELLDGGGSLVATATTNAAGAYLFTGLNPGAYSVREPAQPPGTANGKTKAGSVGNGGTAGAPTAQSTVPSQVAGIVLPPATASVGNDFAEVPAGRQIGGRVFVDTNNDGAFNGADAGLSGVTIQLTGADFNGLPVNAQTLTTADGRYVFLGLAAGTYVVTEPSQPAETTNGITTAGSTGGLATATTLVPSVISGINLTGTNTISTGNDFAEIAAPSATSTSIGGRVYVDLNNNGVVEAGEPGIPDVTLRLTGVDQAGVAVDRTTTTNADGGYRFDNLVPSGPAGYTVTQVQPGAYTDGKTTIGAGQPGLVAGGKPIASGQGDVITGIVLPADKAFTSYDFGELRAGASVSGYVFVDGDNDGVRGPAEPGIADVAVRLTGTDNSGAPVDMTQITDASGGFRFEAPPSNGAGYTITEVQPAGYTDGKTGRGAGAPGAAVTGKPVGVGNIDQITGVVLGVGVSLSDYRFGEIAIPSLRPPLLNGYVYLDRTHTRVRPTDGLAAGQQGWTVVLRQNEQVICTTTTDATGFYQFDNLRCPGYEASGLPTGSGFSIAFSKDGNNLPNVPTSGGNRGVVPPTGGLIQNITLAASDRVVEQNLPLDPAGVVYNALTRQPVAGAVVTITGPGGFDPATHLVGGSLAAVQTTGTDGFYQFLLQNGFPSGVYTLLVTAPEDYLPGPSGLLPPCTTTLNVGLAPDPALIQANDLAPGLSSSVHAPAACVGLTPGGATSTQYYLRFGITNGGSAPILNNHIPLDPLVGAGILVTKTTPLVSVGRGGLVPYTITATNPLEIPLSNVSVRDQLPPGFKLREGSAARNGQAVTPNVSGGFVTWPAETFAPKEKKSYSLILVVGSGVGDGDYVNHAWLATAKAGTVISNTATASVRIVPDPTFDCPDIIGKVFDDKNANGYQDDGEPGIPAVRMATPNGLLITSDAEGRFHVPCPAIPNPDRGSNFVMKLDERSLPSGFRITTENPRDVRVTRGKMVKLNFGATIHRVVRVELAAAAFQEGGVDLLAEWRSQIEALPDKLRERPSVVRVAYERGDEAPELAKRRASAVRDLIQKEWKSSKGQYALVVEIEGQQ
jgi:uncharacterized repeat protein (TIGR01451 family)